MRQIVVAVIAVCVLSVLAPAPAASADTPGCVTRAEFTAVHLGYTRLAVTQTFDTSGRRESLIFADPNGRNLRMEIRKYPKCDSIFFVTVTFAKEGAGPWLLLTKKNGLGGWPG